MKLHFFLTIFVSAFLLLLIQPMMAKLMLPQIGGAPFVWIASMLFFQLVLLAGYGYAALTTALLNPRQQWFTHMGVFCLAIITAIPLHLSSPDLQATSQPTLWVLATLALSVGLPYFTLSASSSLLQRWYFSQTGKEPYFLFSTSNAGSLIGLFAYPLVIEWSFGLSDQLIFFSAGFALLTALFVMMVLWTKTSPQHHQNHQAISTALPFKHAVHTLWLAFLPSALFLALTLYITTDVGSLPMIWVIPLSLYLISFVIVFSRISEPATRLAQKLHPFTIVAFIISLIASDWAMVMVAHFALFFIVAVSCHGQLARIRPEPSKLTSFFFWVSFGGALGGALNVAAPALWNDTYEYTALMLLSLLALPAKRSMAQSIEALKQNASKAVSGFIAITLLVCVIWFGGKPPMLKQDILHQSRNFYGVSIVKSAGYKDTKSHSYLHGTTTHGIQLFDPEYKLKPASYYVPIADLVNKLPDSFFQKPFAVLGLGAGTVACYGRTNQEVDFYEIDQAVIDIAKNPDYFTYLRDCPPTSNIILGDGRIELQKRNLTNHYNLLIMDAFTSDAIPMHLLTIEAMDIYAKAMAEETGIIAFNISNRYYELSPFLTRIAKEQGWESYFFSNQYRKVKYPEVASQWLIMVRENSPYKPQLKQAGFTQTIANDTTALWTDDYSHILPAMKSIIPSWYWPQNK